MTDNLDRPLVLRNAQVPAALLATSVEVAVTGDCATVDVVLRGATIEAITAPNALDLPDHHAISLDGGMVWPCYVDAHTHLDSSQIWPRTPNPDGAFMSAADAMIADRETHWSPEDMRRRMNFSLRCAYAHGTALMRTHLASQNDQVDRRWAVFREVRQDWDGRVALQAVPLISTEALRDDATLATIGAVASQSGGVMGAFAPMAPDIEAVLHRVFAVAEQYGLGLDFHADETGDPNSQVLAAIARVALERRFTAPILVGHCCSLAQCEADVIDRTLDLVAQAGLGVVSLPACNLYLQDRSPGRTPRWRGVTLVQEMRARGVPVVFGGDNCRDPFHPYGDFDQHQVFTDAVRACHLDYPVGDWVDSVSRLPARLLGHADWTVAPGARADLVLFAARTFNELLSRPQGDRRVIRAGRLIDATPPDFRELDPLLETTP